LGGLRRLSGDDVVRIFQKAGFVVQSQKGSHIKLRRTTPAGDQVLTIPRHREIDTGTLRAIVRQAARYLPEAWLHANFYS
jgi:predicted RNA binding protein YcfA (HicA-like mRNA interferase family)